MQNDFVLCFHLRWIPVSLFVQEVKQMNSPYESLQRSLVILKSSCWRRDTMEIPVTPLMSAPINMMDWEVRGLRIGYTKSRCLIFIGGNIVILKRLELITRMKSAEYVRIWKQAAKTLQPSFANQSLAVEVRCRFRVIF